jgi:hypothetical protein
MESADRTRAGFERRISRRRGEAESVRVELAAARKKHAATRTEFEAKSKGPRVTYILNDAPGALEPWLVEVTGSSIRVASRDGASSVIEFLGEGKTQQRLFLSWALQQKRSTHYFVLLIKPSGADRAEEVQRDLREAKRKIGTDLLPEHWSPF